MLGPAGEIELIKSGVDYSKRDTDGELKQHLIFSIHCIKTNTCPVEVTTLQNYTVTFPPGSFVQGAVYHIYIKKIIFNSDEAGFVGYRLQRSKKHQD